jgi:N-formylglutamate amidohydrolase
MLLITYTIILTNEINSKFKIKTAYSYMLNLRFKGGRKGKKYTMPIDHV